VYALLPHNRNVCAPLPHDLNVYALLPHDLDHRFCHTITARCHTINAPWEMSLAWIYVNYNPELFPGFIPG
jgi:hypothetical protein